MFIVGNNEIRITKKSSLTIRPTKDGWKILGFKEPETSSSCGITAEAFIHVFGKYMGDIEKYIEELYLTPKGDDWAE